MSKIRVTVDETGVVTCSDKHGDVLKGRELSMAWDRHADAIRTLMEDALERINGDVDLLKGICYDAPFPSPEVLLVCEPFAEPEPQKPVRSSYPLEPRLELPSIPGTLSRLFGGQKRFEKRVRELELGHAQAIDRHNQIIAQINENYATAIRQWQGSHARWIEAKEAHSKKAALVEQEYRNKLASDEEFAGSELENALNDLDWPRETLTSYELERDHNSVWLDVDFPEIEDLPQRVAAIAASGKKINVKTKPQKALRLEYANHIHGIALRLACVSSATLPWASVIVVSGYSQRMDSATGHTNDDYLLSVRFTRAGLERLNFDDMRSIDPVSAVAAFEHQRKMTATGIFKAISPYAPE
ncbi:hypothetical protein BKI51_02495 [Alphaproteobacteria bacterium AO1-B]|nr:hypothetical protein BKI51_02495 [Alphaproteobacteria bacterium AO1-B]